VCRVHVVIVTAAPKERFTVWYDLDIVCVYVMTTENVPFRVAKITANHADGINFGEKTRLQTKMRRRTAKHFFAFAKWRLEGIKSNRTNNC